MKKQLIYLFIVFISFSSCKSAKQIKSESSRTSRIIIDTNSNGDLFANNPLPSTNINNIGENNASINLTGSKAFSIVEYAKQFKGVRYKFGGATKSGMDCSGLVFESFRSHDIILPRISRDMAKNGEKIPLNRAGIGDLVFFKTGSRRNEINHVGLVVSKDERGNVEFIHSSTSAGVIVSSIAEAYWDKSFVEARRIL
jgi:cell wall-associated NlpC family hydrolase